MVLDIVKVYLMPSAFLSFAAKLDLKSLLCLISFKDIIIKELKIIKISTSSSSQSCVQ